MQYGMLTFVRKTKQRRNNHVVGLWLCACGNTREIANYVVKSGRAKSCGCLKAPHGMARERPTEYAAWMSMNNRCNSPNATSAKQYCLRGIDICERWKDFRTFLADMGRRPSALHSLGRIDNNKGYSPENCRWETPAQQMVNRGISRFWHIKGQIFESSTEAAKCFGVHPSTICYWVKIGKEGCHAKPRY